jgi:hypothetical protein
MPNDAAELARRLAREAQAVCAHYLSNGRRQGRYWHVGDVHNTPGRSLYVRLFGPESGPGAAGHWTDAATGEFGDLLDLIRLRQGHAHLCETLEEARAFLTLPSPDRPPAPSSRQRDTRHAALRLFHATRPATGTLAEIYLRSRGITCVLPAATLRFHPACYYRPEDDAPLQTWPALISAVTDLAGTITGVQRTWLARDGSAKAPLAEPRRGLGRLLGHGVRIGICEDVLAAAEGLENALSLRTVLPNLPVLAALSANHLCALDLPASLRRLYIAADRDADGLAAAARLMSRARRRNVAAYPLIPAGEDWNCDLIRLGDTGVRDAILEQLCDEDSRALW